MIYSWGIILSIFSLFSGPSLATRAENISTSYAQEFGKNERFADAFVANTGLSKYTWHKTSLVLIGHQNLKLNEAQSLARTCFKNFAIRMKKELGKDSPELNFRKLACIRMSFWDMEWNRKMPPNIAEIQVYGDKFRYFESNRETQELVLVLEEPYEQDIIDLIERDFSKK